MDAAEALQNRVREFRTRLRLRQADLACQAGVTRQTIVAIEKGKLNPSVSLSLKLARALGEPVESIFSLAPPAEKPIESPPEPKRPRRPVPTRVQRQDAPPAVVMFGAPAVAVEDAGVTPDVPVEMAAQEEDQVFAEEPAQDDRQEGRSGREDEAPSPEPPKAERPVQAVWDFV